MKTLIIDNEEDVIVSLKHLLDRYCPAVEIVGEANTATTAIELISQTDFDLLFLDVELGDGTGMEVLEACQTRDFNLIFITAYSHYAIEAFRFSAIDYLLKPFDAELLQEAVNRAQTQLAKESRLAQLTTLFDHLGNQHPPQKLVLRDMDNIHLFEIQDLLHCKAEGSYTRLYFTNGKEILSSKNLKHFEQLLKTANFFRPHQSHVVNLAKVARFERVDGGTLVLQNGAEIPVSVRRHKALVQRLMAM